MKTTPESVPYKNEFTESLLKIGARFSVPKVFEDFLTMSIAACTQNILTKLSYYETEYLKTIEPYKDSELRHEFPKAFSNLIFAMEDTHTSSQGNDVLGEFFEQEISHGRNGQFFTPYPICTFMAKTAGTTERNEDSGPARILDPACGSSRMLMAYHKQIGGRNEYYGIDIDMTCVKMSALNLFLNGMWPGEVMCANALDPSDFRISYRISFLPLGIFKIETKEQSRLWNLHRSSFGNKTHNSSDTVEKPTIFKAAPTNEGTQLILF